MLAFDGISVFIPYERALMRRSIPTVAWTMPESQLTPDNIVNDQKSARPDTYPRACKAVL
jgi:hypothetical protein